MCTSALNSTLSPTPRRRLAPHSPSEQYFGAISPHAPPSLVGEEAHEVNPGIKVGASHFEKFKASARSVKSLLVAERELEVLISWAGS
ncbi:hypothetical protein CesoFtcFv8_020392 [Champsocephalus esox]|uniref:Uncharacterized protein n=1 Tax=Champsocephalus esox TaxID=159716 RepID=A0AAN8BGL4_9TELE|nr:hypothetical protein CesoFtcFv8_020392 [Champsocephalus esox]